MRTSSRCVFPLTRKKGTSIRIVTNEEKFMEVYHDGDRSRLLRLQ